MIQQYLVQQLELTPPPSFLVRCAARWEVKQHVALFQAVFAHNCIASILLEVDPSVM